MLGCGQTFATLQSNTYASLSNIELQNNLLIPIPLFQNINVMVALFSFEVAKSVYLLTAKYLRVPIEPRVLGQEKV